MKSRFRITDTIMVIAAIIILAIVGTKLGDIDKHGVDKINKIYKSQDDYITESAPQATQLNTQLSMEMTKEVGNVVAIIGSSIVILLGLIILILLYAAIKIQAPNPMKDKLDRTKAVNEDSDESKPLNG
ncbi:putative membrane protein [Bacillus phage SP-15]|uniref:Putative membrane protein n=1 Tax=Bacillus phage SP-15 TaxID=1792032 RepID=A0A127AZ02_9CAUD|nr:hypothetical protein SP15_211 [Bacillus phage SP-15]AMM45011.1 putative membrane protein [Bacillus phage SP-15]